MFVDGIMTFAGRIQFILGAHIWTTMTGTAMVPVPLEIKSFGDSFGVVAHKHTDAEHHSNSERGPKKRLATPHKFFAVEANSSSDSRRSSAPF